MHLGAGRVGTDEQQRRRRRRGRPDHDSELHRARLFQRLDHLGNRRLLLPDGVIDADDVVAALIQDRVDGDGGLAGLPVTDDELALTAANRHHGVNRLETGLQRNLYALPVDDARGNLLDR